MPIATLPIEPFVYLVSVLLDLGMSVSCSHHVITSSLLCIPHTIYTLVSYILFLQQLISIDSYKPCFMRVTIFILLSLFHTSSYMVHKFSFTVTLNASGVFHRHCYKYGDQDSIEAFLCPLCTTLVAHQVLAKTTAILGDQRIKYLKLKVYVRS